MKPKNKNAKDPAFEVPVKLHSVKPSSYAKSIGSANGSAKSKKAGRSAAAAKKH